jgi:hypothetical protein
LASGRFLGLARTARALRLLGNGLDGLLCRRGGFAALLAEAEAAREFRALGGIAGGRRRVVPRRLSVLYGFPSMKEISASGVTDLRIWAGVGLSAVSVTVAAGADSFVRAAWTPARRPGSSLIGTELFET